MDQPLNIRNENYNDPEGDSGRIVPSSPDSAIPFHHITSLIPAISARILNASPQELDETIHLSLQGILESLGLERGALFEVSQGLCKVVAACGWHGLGAEPVSSTMHWDQAHPWTYNQLVVLGQTVIKYGIDSMPAEAVLDRQAFVRCGAKSTLAIPLFIGQCVNHIIVVHSLKNACVWPESFIASLRLLGEIFAGALKRRDALKSLEIQQTRFDMAVDSSGVALWEIDLASGHIWATSKARELFYFQQDDIITVSRFLEKVHPEDRSLITEGISSAVNSAVEAHAEFRVPALDGSNRWMTSRGRVHEKGPNKSKVMSGVTLEITQLKEMECQLAEHVREISRLRELLEQENALLRSEVGLDEERHGSLGSSGAMQRVRALVEQVAHTDSTVLIHGETGTGKELVAQAIHQLSRSNKRLMITVNCAALPAALIESELFGREKGAFTGAISRQVGRFELAHGSTLLLDEIAEMPLETQAKLLRVLQDGTFERLGSPVSIKAEVRIIAATNRNLVEEVGQGRFRRDLFYRLNVFPIYVPPLRERVEDIPLLVWKFINEFGQKMGRMINRIAGEDMDMLVAYSWPGNVRELRNVIERAMITSQGGVLNLSHVDMIPSRRQSSPVMTIAEVEYRHIQETLKLTQGRIKGKGGAAELLGINPSTLYSRLRKHASRHAPAKGMGDISSRKG